MVNQFLVFLCNTIMTNFDKHNNFNLRMCNSKIQLITIISLKGADLDIKRDTMLEFRRIVCWMSGKHY